MGLSFHAAFPAILASSTLIIMICFLGFPEMATAQIRVQNVTRLCHTKTMVTVNGKFPGPRIIAREGDRVIVKVENHVSNNISIHWHGIRQIRNGPWADGAAYITQCPIQMGQSYAGEWWNSDTEAVISQALQTGAGPNVSDAYTINGLPGPLYNCSSAHVAGILEYDTPATCQEFNQNHHCSAAAPAAHQQHLFRRKLRSLGSSKFPAKLCSSAWYALIFSTPTIALLHSKNSNGSEFTPQISQASLSCPPFNYTGTPPNNTMVANATKVVVLPYVQHHRGAGDAGYQYSWRSDPSSSPSWTLLLYYVVGQGFRNFDLKKDPPKYNLVDPVERKPSASELTILRQSTCIATTSIERWIGQGSRKGEKRWIGDGGEKRRIRDEEPEKAVAKVRRFGSGDGARWWIRGWCKMVESRGRSEKAIMEEEG
nr:laccase-17-like [Ipomoea batatas]